VILNKLLPPLNMAVAEVAREEGVPAQTLCNWRSKAKKSVLPVPGNPVRHPQQNNGQQMPSWQ
jgi:transposase-like protein